MPKRFPESGASRYGHFVENDQHLFDDMSMLTAAELIADPELGLELVAGRGGAEREIEAAAVSELANPGPWLQGGELLLTIGLLLPQTTDGCRSYLAGLDAAGVQALGLGLGAELPHQRAPARLITAADEIGMPLLTVPDPVPFIAVTKAVFAYRARAERHELEWALQTQRALTAAAVTPGGLLGPACQPGAGQAHARRGDRQQPVAAQHGWGAIPSGLRRRCARPTRRNGSFR